MTSPDLLAAAVDDGLISPDAAIDLLLAEGQAPTADDAAALLAAHHEIPADHHLLWSMP